MSDTALRVPTVSLVVRHIVLLSALLSAARGAFFFDAEPLSIGVPDLAVGELERATQKYQLCVSQLARVSDGPGPFLADGLKAAKEAQMRAIECIWPVSVYHGGNMLLNLQTGTLAAILATLAQSEHDHRRLFANALGLGHWGDSILELAPFVPLVQKYLPGSQARAGAPSLFSEKWGASSNWESTTNRLIQRFSTLYAKHLAVLSALQEVKFVWDHCEGGGGKGGLRVSTDRSLAMRHLVNFSLPRLADAHAVRDEFRDFAHDQCEGDMRIWMDFATLVMLRQVFGQTLSYSGAALDCVALKTILTAVAGCFPQKQIAHRNVLARMAASEALWDPKAVLAPSVFYRCYRRSVSSGQPQGTVPGDDLFPMGGVLVRIVDRDLPAPPSPQDFVDIKRQELDRWLAEERDPYSSLGDFEQFCQILDGYIKTKLIFDPDYDQDEHFWGIYALLHQTLDTTGRLLQERRETNVAASNQPADVPKSDWPGWASAYKSARCTFARLGLAGLPNLGPLPTID